MFIKHRIVTNLISSMRTKLNIALLSLSAGILTLCANYGTTQAQESLIKNSTPIAASDSDLLTSEMLRNRTYYIPDLGSITLTNGTYQEESEIAARMSNLFALGDLNEDQRDDAAVLIQVTHDSGTFAYLAAVVTQNSEFVNVDTIFLGNWQDAKAISVNAGQISVEMDEPSAITRSSYPSEKIVQTYRFDADTNKLTGISLNDEPPLEEADEL